MAEGFIERRQALADPFKDLCKVLSAIGYGNRQHVFATLMRSDSEAMRIPEIVDATHLSRPVVIRHLKRLHETGLVSVRREGTMTFYSVDISPEVWARLVHFVAEADELIRLKTADKSERAG